MKAVTVRAIRTFQGNCEVFAFFIPGERLLEIADISRIDAQDPHGLSGFQRPEIRSHVRNIVEYLERGPALFPNAIIIALAPGTKFTGSRGTKPQGLERLSDGGTLRIPVRPGLKTGWIVDGQQRTLALAKTGGAGITVPVVAFVSADLAMHREQFILVNKAKPLSHRLIDELLPEVGALLPRDLSVRRVPSTLCRLLNDSMDSPFRALIRRPSHESESAVVLDSSLIRVMKRSIQDPRGALAVYVSPDGSADLEAMYRVMRDFWTAVRDVFPTAWARPPDESRLMHSAGIEAMGILMDQVMTRADSLAAGYDVAKRILTLLAPDCRWVSGHWDRLGREWNDIQCTRKDIRSLSNLLIAMERDVSVPVAA
ncbi:MULTISPECIES: DGQHR domain-containing protein DpdB [unclassified Bradyrhizobium]|uniref:DGQHR domain-containing protein DpdB n=1 Tax=unclassified Bradyrhizobium TaxID=2631580 RepID=UPI0029165E64|nr:MULTISPECIES: DGQHR domain-containing protein DpdB [unclassified Bradyrhizobium]